MTPRNTPPPILCSARVLYYAIADNSVTFKSRKTLWVDDKLLGKVPRLAIVENMREPEFLLLFCNNKWDTKGIIAFPSVKEAKQRAESEYHGIIKKWVKVKSSKNAVLKQLQEMWEREKCAFCGKLPVDVEQMFASDKSMICNECVTFLYQQLAK